MDIRLPQLAEGADSGTVVSILVAEGAQIQKDQTVIELENQKAVAPIPSPAAGTVTKVHVKVGDSVTVGQLLVSFTEEGAGAPAAPAASPAAPQGQAAQAPAAAAPAAAPASGEYRYVSKSGLPPPASPTVRKMARDLGIDLTRVRGSSDGGRITTEDLRTYITALQSGGAFAAPAAVKKPALPDFKKWGSVARKPFSPLRRAIARAMVDSWTTIPHVTQFDDLDVTHLQELVAKHLPAYEKQGARLTLTVILLKVLAAVLKKYPVFNSSLDETANELVIKEYIHIGIAVDTEGGLIVPVLRDIDKKSLLQIAKDLKSLAEQTRGRTIPNEELQGGSFTISNQGGIGGGHFTPIIHAPEAAILGVGRAKQQPVYLKDGSAPAPRWMLPVSLSYDHRIIDGADAARFMVELAAVAKNFSENEVKL